MGKNDGQDAQRIDQATLRTTGGVEGKSLSSSPEQFRFTDRFPDVALRRAKVWRL
jgi:hypothetical protein